VPAIRAARSLYSGSASWFPSSIDVGNFWRDSALLSLPERPPQRALAQPTVGRHEQVVSQEGQAGDEGADDYGGQCVELDLLLGEEELLQRQDDGEAKHEVEGDHTHLLHLVLRRGQQAQSTAACRRRTARMSRRPRRLSRPSVRSPI